MTPSDIALFKHMWCAVIDGLVDLDQEPEIRAMDVALAAVDHITDIPDGTSRDTFVNTLMRMADCILKYQCGGAA